MSRSGQEQGGGRRHGYSFRGHLRRVVSQKGLRHVVLSVGSTALVLTGVLAYCRASNITGPSMPNRPQNAPTASRSVGTISAVKTALAVFPTDMLPAFHPCNPTLSFTEMQGQNQITYTDEILYDANGQPTGEHRVRYDTHETQSGKDKNGRAWKGEKKESKEFTFKNPGHSTNSVNHFKVNGEPCTITYNSKSAQDPSHTGGPGCDETPSEFDSSPTYQYTLVEDPLTREGTLIVTTLGITSSCPSLISMTEPRIKG